MGTPRTDSTHLSTLLKSLSDDTRLRILRSLTDEELSVGEIVSVLNLSQSKVSRHLAHLKETGWVDDRRDGIWVFYNLKKDVIQSDSCHRELWDVLSKQFRAGDFYPDDGARLQVALEARKNRGKAFIERDAGRWDQLRDGLVGENTVVSALGTLIDFDKTILDVGCGTGRFVTMMAGMVRRTVGLDYSSKMLDLTRERLTAAGVSPDRFRLVEADMEEMPFRNGEFDAVFASLVLRYSSNPHRALAEMYRVLRPGGALAITDIVKHDQEWVREQFGDQWLGFEPNDVADWVRGMGFERVEIEREPAVSQSGLSLFVVRAREKTAAPPKPKP